MSDTEKILYPELEAIQREQEEKKQGATEEKSKGKTTAEVLYPEPEESEHYDFEMGDPEVVEYENALELFQGEKYQELAGLVERELTALKAGPEEFGLFSFAKKHADDSPEWADWLRKAVRNLYQHKRAARLGTQNGGT